MVGWHTMMRRPTCAREVEERGDASDARVCVPSLDVFVVSMSLKSRRRRPGGLQRQPLPSLQAAPPSHQKYGRWRW